MGTIISPFPIALKLLGKFNNKILLPLLFLSQLRLTTSQYYLEDKPCAVLHSEENFDGHQFALKDGEQTNHLGGDNLGWNVTGSVSVETGCLLEVCNNAYFDCDWKTLLHGSYATTDSLNLSDISSASCTCHKECKCSDIFMKKSSCARAYLEEGGCRTCHSLYTDMQGAQPHFPEEFVGDVEAFRLRKGCSITLYRDENFKGESVTFYQETVEDYSGEFRSYECECDDTLFEPRAKPPRPASYPPLIDIPETLDDAIKKMTDKKYSSHPGIRASHMSLQNKRSPKNAYILLLGSTGSGRSTAINLLFDNPNITSVGGETSTTTDIHEFRIPVPIDELGIGNSEIRIIDTPGLGHTDGLLPDAKFLSTLDSYLSSHEELKDRIPNVVLIFHKYYDNRFSGEGSAFVKMLRGLNSLRGRITDENYSNVIFVMSHFCSETKANQKRPTARLARFKSVIEEYSLFPKPILITVAENKAKEQNLPMVNGYFKLPNNEYYPKNLFDKMELVTEMGGDMIGLGVFRSAFRDSDDFNVTSLTYKLLDDSPKLDHYMRIISNTHFSIENTEVSELLQRAWEDKLNVSLKKQFPGSLPYLQKALGIKHINTKDDLPKTTADILTLVTAIKHDDATIQLLRIGLDIEAPHFPYHTGAGFSYNVFNDSYLPTSPFNLGDVMGSDIGFLIPKTLTCKLVQSTKQNFHIFDTRQQYLQYRLQSLGIEGTIANESFQGEVQPGHNIKEISFKEDGCSLSATREFRLFDFTLNDRVDLSQEFKNAVQNLPALNESDYQNVEMWLNFFNKYGTHIVKSVHGGGAIEIQLHSDKPYDSNLAQALFDLIQFAEELPYVAVSDGAEEGDSSSENGGNATKIQTVLSEGIAHSLKYVGGDTAYHSKDFTNMSVEQASKLLRKWKTSLKFNPTILSSEMGLVPISQIVKKLGQIHSSKIERAASLLFKSELKYSLPKKSASSPGRSREDISLMNRFLELQARSNQEIQRLMMELKNTELEQERRRQDIEARRLEYEREHKKANLEHEKLHSWHTQRAEREYPMTHRDVFENMKAMRTTKIFQKLSLRTPPGNCLKRGTKILLADMREKAVETVKIGDLIMDKDFRPSRVIGVSFEFLMGHKLYGFHNDSYFFTDGHLFVGPSEGGQSRLYAQSLHEVIRSNPLMEYMNVSEFRSNEGAQLFHLQQQNGSMDRTSPAVKSVKVEEDPTSYPQDTPVYFLIVDSPTGTYFANGYVCRHDIPPMGIWPNTMALLFRLAETPAFQRFANLPYNLGTVSFIKEVTDQVTELVQNYIQQQFHQGWASSGSTSGYPPVLTLSGVNLEESISKAFENPAVSSLSIVLYAQVGRVISPYLDSASYGKADDIGSKMGQVQHEILNIIGDELNRHFKSYGNMLYAK